MDNIAGCVLTIAITFPLSCLRGVIRLVTGEENRRVL